MIAARPASRGSSDVLVNIYVNTLGPGSRRAMRQALTRVAQVLTGRDDTEAGEVAWPTLTSTQLAELRAKLLEDEGLAPATVNKLLSAVRGVLRVAVKRGKLKRSELDERLKVLRVVEGGSKPGRVLGRTELARVMRACRRQASPTRERNLALVSLLVTGQLHRIEAVQLQLSDYERKKRQLAVQPMPGTVGEARQVTLPPAVVRHLEAWLDQRGGEPGPLFVPVNKSGRIRLSPRPMTDQSVYELVRRLGQEAGLAGLNPQTLRRTGQAFAEAEVKRRPRPPVKKN